MVNSINIRGVEYNLDVKWTEAKFKEIWENNKKILSCMKVAKDKEKAFMEDWEKLKQFIPDKKKSKQEGVQ